METQQVMEMSLENVRVGDVFSFRWNEKELKERFSPYHCFDGTLVAKDVGDGNIILVDTYWSGSDNRVFTIEKALEKGYLEFICNLDEVESVDEWKRDYYDNGDFISLRIHAGYRNQYYIKKGANRSAEKMLEAVDRKIEDAKARIESAKDGLMRHRETKKKIEEGDLTVYI